MQHLLQLGFLLVFGIPFLSAQNNNDLFFFAYPEQDGYLTETKFYSPAATKYLKQDFQQLRRRNLPVMFDKNRLVLPLTCDQVSGYAMCINSQQFDSIIVSSPLMITESAGNDPKSRLGLDYDSLNQESVSMKADLEPGIESGRLILRNSANPDSIQSGGVHFINLTKLLLGLYPPTQEELLLCCPDGDLANIKENTLKRICQLLAMSGGGIKIEIFKAGSTQFTFHVRDTDHLLSMDEPLEKVEPRRYVTIYEKLRKNSPEELIWWLEERLDTLPGELGMKKNRSFQFFQHQRYPTVDVNSTLMVKFDQEALAGNLSFYGNISLSAKIGDRNLEVNPYSKVGEKQNAYGVNSKPIRDIADNYMQLLIESRRAVSIYNDLKEELIYLLEVHEEDREFEVTRLLERINYVEEYFEHFANGRDGYPDTSGYVSYIPSEMKYEVDKILYAHSSKVLYNFRKNPELYKYEDVLTEIVAIKEVYLPLDSLIKSDSLTDEQIEQEYQKLFREHHTVDDDLQNSGELYGEFIATLNVINDNLAFFDSSGDQSVNAFLNLTSLTKIDFQLVSKSLRDNIARINNYTTWSKLKDVSVTEALPVAQALIEIMTAMQRLSAISGDLEVILEQVGFPRFLNVASIEKERQSRIDAFKRNIKIDSSKYEGRELEVLKGDSLKYFKEKYNTRANFYHWVDSGYSIASDYTKYKKVRDKLARLAGRRIYNHLVYATIDLEKENLKDGDILEISVLWFDKDMEDNSPENATALATAKFEAVNVGWAQGVSDSFLFIHRFKEADADVATLNSSDFKPTGGISYMWSLQDDKRGKAKWIEKVIQPSIGINASYVDFSSAREFELGVGVIGGLFNDLILFNWGYNIGVRGRSPFYFGFGLSFVNTVKKLTNKND